MHSGDGGRTIVRAVLCRAYGPPESLVVEDVPSLVPGPGEIVISVKAASVNFPDVLIIQNKYQFKPPLPFSPGSEVAGIVKLVGDGVTTAKVGDHVMAATIYGGFAEEVKTDATRALPLPEGMDFAIASAFAVTYGTSDHALRDRGRLHSRRDGARARRGGRGWHCPHRNCEGGRGARDCVRIARRQTGGLPRSWRGRDDQRRVRRPSRASEGADRR